MKPLDIAVPKEVGRYAVGERIGSGTCGVVHRGLDTVLKRDVAVKLSPAGDMNVSTGKVPGAQRAYQVEIVAAGRLRHPNIVTVYDAGQYDDLNYLVMERVEGKSLKEFGKGKTLLPVHRALEVISECCAALDYSHEQDILHRDIKPANIMIGDDNSVKLLDFGIAVGLTGAGGLSKQGPTLGTPNYMSPEQILGRELGPASDFYSLSTVLFELLTGRQLFKARKVKELFRMVVQKKAPLLHEVRPELPVGLSKVLARALEKKPELRFQSGAEMAEALAPFIERLKVVEARPEAQQKFIRYLTSHQFFDGFSESEIAQFLELAEVRDFDQGDWMIEVGNTDRQLLVMLSGALAVRDESTLIRVSGEGDCVGELGFIHGTAETRTVEALSPVRALMLSADSLTGLPPKVHLRFYRHVSATLGKRLAQDAGFSFDVEL